MVGEAIQLMDSLSSSDEAAEVTAKTADENTTFGLIISVQARAPPTVAPSTTTEANTSAGATDNNVTGAGPTAVVTSSTLAAENSTSVATPDPGTLDLIVADVGAGATAPADEILNAVLELVVDDWSDGELTESQTTWLGSLTIELANLDGDKVAELRDGILYIDVDAAGRGWFVAPEVFEALTRSDNNSTALLTGNDSSVGVPDAMTKISASSVAPNNSTETSDGLMTLDHTTGENLTGLTSAASESNDDDTRTLAATELPTVELADDIVATAGPAGSDATDGSDRTNTDSQQDQTAAIDEAGEEGLQVGAVAVGVIAMTYRGPEANRQNRAGSKNGTSDKTGAP
ncbi:MAG: hypothetical protein O7G83_07330, partial [Proteobacteria bacterium]|nr:hypothetical protein [Pseudomonadota bacterium]